MDSKNVNLCDAIQGAHIDLTTSVLALHFTDGVTLTVKFERNSKIADSIIDLRNGKVEKIELITN